MDDTQTNIGPQELIGQLRKLPPSVWSSRILACLSRADWYAEAMRLVLEGKPAFVQPLQQSSMEVLFSAFELKGQTISRIWVHPILWADLRMFSREDLDIESSGPLLREGIQATLWGAQIRTPKSWKLEPYSFVVITENDGDDDLSPDWRPLPERCLQVLHV